jgi:hypothetical protein
LLGATGGIYRDYAKDCLGLTIGDAPEYKVTSISDAPLLVGLNGAGSWTDNDCSSQAQDDKKFRVALYAGMDYSDLAGYAWYSSASNDPVAQSIAQEIFSPN